MTGSTTQQRGMIAANAGTPKGFASDWFNFLVANGGAGAKSERDAEMRFLASKGFTQLTYADRLTAYLSSKGFTTGTIGDRYKAWLVSGVL